MILLVLMLLGVAITILQYMRNKRIDRINQHRDRIEEKREQLLENLRARKTDKEKEQ